MVVLRANPTPINAVPNPTNKVYTFTSNNVTNTIIIINVVTDALIIFYILINNYDYKKEEGKVYLMGNFDN